MRLDGWVNIHPLHALPHCDAVAKSQGMGKFLSKRSVAGQGVERDSFPVGKRVENRSALFFDQFSGIFIGSIP
jgi:hypothetical protein